MKKIVYILFFLGYVSIFAGHSFHHPEVLMKQLEGDKKPGNKIYASFCANCHDKKPLINLGAPRIGEKADWETRLKQPWARMMKKVYEGVGAMPQRGGCFECSDKMLEAAVQYMLPKKKLK